MLETCLYMPMNTCKCHTSGVRWEAPYIPVPNILQWQWHVADFWDLKQHVLPNTIFWSLVFSLVHMASLLVGCQPTLCAARLRGVWLSLRWGASGGVCREGWEKCNSKENLASMLNKLKDGREEAMLSFWFQRMGNCKEGNLTRNF